jgi:hypothetical protein
MPESLLTFSARVVPLRSTCSNRWRQSENLTVERRKERGTLGWDAPPDWEPPEIGTFVAVIGNVELE